MFASLSVKVLHSPSKFGCVNSLSRPTPSPVSLDMRFMAAARAAAGQRKRP